MVEREDMPCKRFGCTRKVRVGGQKIYLTVNAYPDGRPGEIFISAAKTGALVQALLSNWAIAISVKLQYGIPLREIVDSFEHAKFDPCGPVQGDDEIKWASSVLDYVVKRLKADYLKPDPPAPEKVAGYVSQGSGA